MLRMMQACLLRVFCIFSTLLCFKIRSSGRCCNTTHSKIFRFFFFSINFHPFRIVFEV